MSPEIAIGFCNLDEESVEIHAQIIELAFDYHYNGEEPDEDELEF